MEENTIDGLYRTSSRLMQRTETSFHRYLYDKINWDNRLTAIKGARGVGKTTMLLQYMKERFSNHPERALYISLDNMWFANHSLSDVVEYHYTHGGTHLFIDEVHKYPSWQTLMKNIYDESTADLMISFYRNLMNGATKREALVKAQQEVRSQGFTDPKYWATFILLDAF